jgi:molybdenum cofactor cytidylyltransferase
VAFVSGVVLAAGASRRLGQPKQLLPYRGTTLLDTALAAARSFGFAQLLVTVGGAAPEVRAAVDFEGIEVVENIDYASGCSSSIGAAVRAVDPRAEGIVLLLGDQPGVSPRAVHALVAQAAATPLGVCKYTDALGHPFWFRRDVFAELLLLHGDKAVWKLLESGRYAVTEVDVPEVLPIDVDTVDDYQALLARDEARDEAGFKA